uniref:Uncharacterized protein n=1 Tax=Cacopsylla melanoneura TaxID=428564 RepID=A0A8D8WB58_9HEMI
MYSCLGFVVLDLRDGEWSWFCLRLCLQKFIDEGIHFHVFYYHCVVLMLAVIIVLFYHCVMQDVMMLTVIIVLRVPMLSVLPWVRAFLNSHSFFLVNASLMCLDNVDSNYNL